MKKLLAALFALSIALTCVHWAGEARADTSAPLRSLDQAVSWVNSPPLAPEALRGKVVLLDFWTYSCINCLRTLPYIRAWSDKYRDLGFVVVGVHTPEFGFEHMPANVERAAARLDIRFPVAVDSKRAIWNALRVQGWPSLYFVDATGRVRSRQVGEGGYAEAERTIQQLLREAGRQQVPTDLVAPQGAGTQAAAGPVPPASGETYVGAARSEGFRSASGGLHAGQSHDYTPAPALRLNQWTLGGPWQVGDELAQAEKAGTRIAYRFKARDLHLVLGPGDGGRPVRFRVRLDGQAPGAASGTDVDASGMGTIDSYRLYQLVRQPRSGSGERLFEIEFLDPGARAYAFTFG
jgi:thiol-disulfide isomerase/thioredoxin